MFWGREGFWLACGMAALVKGSNVLFTRTAHMPTTSVFTVFRGLCSRKCRACRVFRRGSGGAGVEASNASVLTVIIWRINVAPAAVFPRPELPWANHDYVQIRPRPFTQSIHGPTMITSRSDHIHSRRASM